MSTLLRRIIRWVLPLWDLLCWGWKKNNGEREVIHPGCFSAAVTVNTYNVTPFYRFQIYVDRMQHYINGHFYCTKPDHLWLQPITVRHGLCDTHFTLIVVVSILTTFLIWPLKYGIRSTYCIPYSVETLSLCVSYEPCTERWWVPCES